MVHEEYSCQRRVDEILDKISKYGIYSVTNKEKDFLDAYSSGNKEKTLDRLSILDKDIMFESSYFKFELEDTIINNHDTTYKGTFYVPDLTLMDGSILEGNIYGELIVYRNGTYILNFDKKVTINNNDFIYEIYEFCEGLEYELDSFIDYIILELS